MLVGFIHGVMNTDNMAMSGETIDYGPCAFMDAYDPETVFSSIDHHGRYAYGNQPAIAQWNLARLAETLLPLIDETRSRAVELAIEVVAPLVSRLQAPAQHTDCRKARPPTDRRMPTWTASQVAGWGATGWSGFHAHVPPSCSVVATRR